MSELVAISVYRELGDRLQPGGSQSDNSPKSWELHCLRVAALHEALGDDPAGWRVIDWGVHGRRAANARACRGSRRTHGRWHAHRHRYTRPQLGRGGAVRRIDRLSNRRYQGHYFPPRRKQEEHKIRDFCISMDGRELMRIDPDALGGAGSVQLQMPDGRFVNVASSATATELLSARASQMPSADNQ